MTGSAYVAGTRIPRRNRIKKEIWHSLFSTVKAPSLRKSSGDWELQWMGRRTNEGKKEKDEEKEVKMEEGVGNSTPYRPGPQLPVDELVGAQVSDADEVSEADVCVTDPIISRYGPLSSWKMTAVAAESLVAKAYELGAVTDDSMQMMLQKLRSIQANIDVTERQLINRASSVSAFLAFSSHTWKFRDTVEELEDAIDELDYLSFEQNDNNPISNFIKRKIIYKLARLDPMSNQKRLRNAVGLLQDVLITTGYDFDPTHLSSHPHHERYSSWLDSDGGIFGRDREIEQTVLWLTKDTDIPVSIFALVGIAGMGKTMLANAVSEDPRVLTNFDNVVWLSVSVDFNTEAIERMIQVSITGTSSIQSMHDSLTDTLSYKKVLLILDDVWEDSSIEKWKTLVAPLKVCKKGSRVLLTTRMQSVVDMAAVAMGTQAECLKLDDLDEDDSLMLLKGRLPSQVDSKDYSNFLLIGDQILKKIGGCPFVISLVASWLGSHMEIQHWITVLQEGWQHIELKDMVIASFRLSYYYLPIELRACFRYCSLFPKGHKFNRTEVARMWISSGVIPFSSLKQEKKSVQNVGEEYFDALARKSFFCCMLETEPSNGDQKEYYVLHSLMHDLADVVSQGECVRVDNGDFHNVRNTTRHLSIANCSILGELRGKFQLLRTLMVTNEFCLDQETELVLGDVLESSRHLRLLYLDVPSLFHALDGVGRLTHLRYLFLFSCDESHLRQVFKLYHLQVFKLKYFTGKEADCSGIHNLHCLQCLHAPDNMSSKIHQVGSLITLQELCGFDVANNDGLRLTALGNLINIRQLSLRNVQNVLNCQEAIGIKLKDKHLMKILSLSWNRNLKKPANQDEQIIDNLEPHEQIQQLHIHGYNGVKLPFWIENSSLIHLVSLELEYCTKWKNLPSLQELNSLKHLKLENLFQLEYIGTMPEQQLEIDENAWLPPFLSTLRVRWCPKLNELPAIPWSLELLIIKHVNLAVLPKIHQRYTGFRDSASVKSQLSFLHIESCTNLTSLEGLLDQQEQLQSLTTLVVRHCERLHHMPMSGFAELHRLNSLEIVACPLLRDVKTQGSSLPTSLKNLELNPCGGVDVSILMSLQNLTALRRLTLFNCSNIEELPSAEVFRTLKNLNDMSVGRCKNLLSFGGLGSVTSLRVLSILCCDKIGFSQSLQDDCSFKLQKLRIDRQAMLTVDPLRSLRHTKELQIGDDYAMVSLHEEWLLQNAASLHSIEIGAVESLHSLPPEMQKLGSLQSLHIERAPLIQSLPQLPASLSKLAIWGCDPMFLKRYERDVGEDWGKIAHIASVDIKAYSEGTYYGDDQSQDFINSNSGRQFVVID